MSTVRTMFGYGKDLWRELSEDNVTDFSAGLAYRFLLALFPFFIFLTALGGFLSQLANIENPSTEILNRLGTALPDDARSVLDSQLSGVLESQQPGLLSIGLIGAIWAAAGGMGATMRAMNHVYDVEEARPFWRRTLLSVGLTLLGAVFFVGAFVLAFAGQAIAAKIVEEIGMGRFSQALISGTGYALAFALLLITMAFLYWAAPNAQLPFRWITPGAVLFTCVWLVATFLFGVYVSRFGSYNATYGALGGVVILMVWFYITSYIMLAGAELNALLAQKKSPEEAEVPAGDPDHWAPDSGRAGGPSLQHRGR